MTQNTYHGHKPFQKQLYKESDKLAKKIVSEFLTSTGKFTLQTPVENQKERFSSRDFDILHLPSEKLISVEVEQKRVWAVEGQWQPGFYDGIDIPYRKVKSKADLFVMINKSGNTLITLPMRVVKDSPCIYKDTKVRGTNTNTKEEPFFRVPLTHEKLKMFQKENNTWVRIP